MLEAYKSWIRRNSGLVSLFETGLSSLTWLLPERFSEGELSIEALHTALGLLSGFHDSIVCAPPGAPQPPGADLALALSTLDQVQVLLELLATRREEAGGGSRYTSLAALEGVKALVRLVVWRRSGARLLLHGGLGNLEQQLPADLRSQGVSQGRPQEVYGAFVAFRQKRCSPYEVPPPQQQDKLAAIDGGCSSAPPGPLARHAALADRLVAAAELLHILRPVAYALALRRWGRRSWKPWLLSLSIDLLSMRLGAAGAAASQSASWFGGGAGAGGGGKAAELGPSLALLRCLQQTRWAAEEERELAARRLRLAVYLLRDPLFARHTQVALERWVSGTARVPLLGWLSGRAVEILVGVQRYYSYVERMAAS